MTYKRPEIIAKNLPTGSYAAGCPSKESGKNCYVFINNGGCKKCERTK